MRRRWRTTTRAGLLAAAVAMTSIGVVADAGAAVATTSIEVTSAQPRVSGDTWVVFAKRGHTRATIRGLVRGVAPGSVARLYATTFPYRSRARVVASTTLRTTAAAYRFTVAPALATTYQVRVTTGSAASTLEAASRRVHVYVTAGGASANHQACARGTCTISISLTFTMPRSALGAEAGKHQYVYLDLTRSPGGVQPTPTTYHLVRATVGAPTVHGQRVHFHVAIRYVPPHYRYWYFWESCTRDTVGRDGLGLPGHHGCGAPTASPRAPYLG